MLSVFSVSTHREKKKNETKIIMFSQINAQKKKRGGEKNRGEGGERWGWGVRGGRGGV